jgi:hypothetical protein
MPPFEGKFELGEEKVVGSWLAEKSNFPVSRNILQLQHYEMACYSEKETTHWFVIWPS